jgi:hypothetical protein
VFIQNAEQMILDKFHQNPQEYKEAYRTSIEQALFVKPDEQHEEKGS